MPLSHGRCGFQQFVAKAVSLPNSLSARCGSGVILGAGGSDRPTGLVLTSLAQPGPSLQRQP